MSIEQWIIAPGESRVIDIDQLRDLKVSLIGGRVDIIAHDEPGARIEVRSVSGKDLKVTNDNGKVEVDHPQLRWDNFIDVFKSFRGSAKVEVSILAPRHIVLKLGVVSGDALVSGFDANAKFSTVSGDLVIDNHSGDIELASVSGELSAGSHCGRVVAHSVSGDIVATGEVTAFHADTVSGDVIVDATNTPAKIASNTVTGSLTVRYRAGSGVRYNVNTVSGDLVIDNVIVKGVFGRGYQHSEGDLNGTWLELSANSVSGAINVIRRPEGATDGSRSSVGGSTGMTPSVFAHGDLRLYLLRLLDEQPRHGYEIIQALSNRFGGTYAPSAGTIYPRLAKLEQEGLVVKIADGRKSIYQITDIGQIELAARQPELDSIEHTVDDSVRRLAEGVRNEVNEAMRSLRAELANAARAAREEARTIRTEARPVFNPAPPPSSAVVHRADLVVNEFRQELRVAVRNPAHRANLTDAAVDDLREALRGVRDSFLRQLSS